MEALIQLFSRDFNKLSEEIKSFENQANLWKTSGDISNTAGNLCLHLVGNLNHFIGAVIGKSGYKRTRDEEFSTRNVAKDDLVAMVFECKETVISTLSEFNVEKLKTAYPIRVFDEDMTYEFFLIHLVAHLNYHLGQINYLRRILES